MTQDNDYPALLIDWLTPVYDLFARLLMLEMRFKRAIITNARLTPGQRVLDLGAGTGTLAIMIKDVQPEIQVVGIDRDPKILLIARQKAARSGMESAFNAGNAVALPFSDQTFDRVLSTLVMSLLSREQKTRAIHEVYRVLKSGGELHIADFGPPRTWWERMVAPQVRRFKPISDNLDGLLPLLFREAGFENVMEAAHYVTLFGAISILSGQKS